MHQQLDPPATHRGLTMLSKTSNSHSSSAMNCSTIITWASGSASTPSSKPWGTRENPGQSWPFFMAGELWLLKLMIIDDGWLISMVNDWWLIIDNCWSYNNFQCLPAIYMVDVQCNEGNVCSGVIISRQNQYGWSMITMAGSVWPGGMILDCGWFIISYISYVKWQW